MRRLLWIGAVVAACWPAGAPAQAPTFPEPKRFAPEAAELAAINAKAAELAKSIAELGAAHPLEPGRTGDAFADVAIYQKAADWIVRHGEFYSPDYARMTLTALDTGLARATALSGGKRPWFDAHGSLIRGYVSKIDGSVQPYAVVVPEQAPEGGRYRLDVVLHGRGANLNEVRFIHDHDGKPAKDELGLVLHVFGRTNNAYRWAGETDVFEAMDAMRRNYPVDERRIVLRGFSMGGAGAWHLGLHHPAIWCAVEAGAGFTETRRYIGREHLPDHEEKALRIYDAVDYALNAFDVPIAGYGGEIDKQLQASVNIEHALAALGVTFKTEDLQTRAEGLDFLRVVGAKTGHAVDPASAVVLKTFRDEHAARGLAPLPRPVRFATYTLKYNQAPGLTIERLEEHYLRAVVETKLAPDETVEVRAENVTILGVDRRLGETVVLGGQRFPLRAAVKGLLPEVDFRLVEGRWEMLDYNQSRALQENAKRSKRPGLQGPIDDAFTGPFLCVRGTGQPWSPRVQAWADARLEEFTKVWDRYLRGRLRIKTDQDVTDDDVEQNHLILFGDPGSNQLIERLLGDLPLRWTRAEITLGGNYPAAEHVPVLITVNPRNPLKYVVLNSGHTFGADAFAGTNALLYPRLGDYAVVHLAGREHTVVLSDYFDEDWKVRAQGPKDQPAPPQRPGAPR